MKKFVTEKKPLFFILLLLVVVGIGGTFAYYYTEVIIPNQFKTLTYNVTVEDEFYDDWGVKKVFFVNKEETNTPVVLRINFNESWRREVDGMTLSLDNNVNGENVVLKEWTDTFTNDFIKGDDGWYYYKKVLNSNERIQVLESIALNEELILTSPYYEDYKVFDYELSFNFEAIQASSGAVSDIWNRNVSISGDEVTWEL